MRVLVLMLLREVEPDAPTNQCGSSNEEGANRLPKEQNRHRSAYERGQREVGSRPCGADVAESQDEHHQAQTVTQEPDEERPEQHRAERHPGTQRESNPEVHDPGGGSFDRRDLERVPGRDFLGEVIVDAPAEARPCHRKRPDRQRQPASALP